MTDLIKIDRMSKTYKHGQIEVHALRDVSLSICKGEFAAIMGPSGSGKSTFMNIIGCLDRPTRGSYFLEGKNVSKLSRDELAGIRNSKIGFVFQNFNLIPRTTALENVEVPLYYRSSFLSPEKNREKAMELLEKVGLKGKEKHTPAQLSGGEQQRVAIARALVNEPSLILADEPTGNLDTKTSLEIVSIFQKLNEESGITVVIVTHELDISAHTKRNLVFLDGMLQKDFSVPVTLNAEVELAKYKSRTR
ncbi:MAG: ABC transporter ATP-binding protein [Armatimonadota bacterium]